MPRKYMFGTRRYFGGTFVDFESEGFVDSKHIVEIYGQLAAPAVVRGVRLPIGSRLLCFEDDGYHASAESPIVVYGHRLPKDTRIEFPNRSLLYALGVFLGKLDPNDDAEPTRLQQLWLVVTALLAGILFPITYPISAWQRARWAKVTVPEPTQIGGLLATTDHPVEISWSGAVRRFEPPWVKIPSATVSGSEIP
jgi:hypothetical protein